MATLEKLSPCKVNLLLNVLGRRPDGFHELETLLHPVAVCDRLVFETAPGGVQLECDQPGLPTDGRNLVHRAASAFLEAAGIRDGVRIRLEKQIPLAAGLGGGSSNAATTLLGLNELFGNPLAAERLHALAAALGSDVPFFLQSRPALATGRGERIEPLDFFPTLRGTFFLLAHPGFGVPTAWAYQNLARFPGALNGAPGRARKLATLLRSSDLFTAARHFYNALEAPVLEKYPLLALFQEFLRSHGAVAALMSGSGSTTFAIVENRREAEALREKFLVKFGRSCWTALVAATAGAAGQVA
ncbi:MAG: 4-(cytidine 5'-diphospho)-2-C-methyl-D-erythritol kinase [Verrucomicrobiales bacterium]|nr:4-(cytidine 5'-diphospho)-2-C-methyl-D-erythritol kinase [Verrucomicrobiales bacterium]